MQHIKKRIALPPNTVKIGCQALESTKHDNLSNVNTILCMYLCICCDVYILLTTWQNDTDDQVILEQESTAWHSWPSVWPPHISFSNAEKNAIIHNKYDEMVECSNPW